MPVPNVTMSEIQALVVKQPGNEPAVLSAELPGGVVRQPVP